MAVHGGHDAAIGEKPAFMLDGLDKARKCATGANRHFDGSAGEDEGRTGINIGGYNAVGMQRSSTRLT